MRPRPVPITQRAVIKSMIPAWGETVPGDLFGLSFFLFINRPFKFFMDRSPLGISSRLRLIDLVGSLINWWSHDFPARVPVAVNSTSSRNPKRATISGCHKISCGALDRNLLRFDALRITRNRIPFS